MAVAAPASVRGPSDGSVAPKQKPAARVVPARLSEGCCRGRLQLFPVHLFSNGAKPAHGARRGASGRLPRKRRGHHGSRASTTRTVSSCSVPPRRCCPHSPRHYPRHRSPRQYSRAEGSTTVLSGSVWDSQTEREWWASCLIGAGPCCTQRVLTTCQACLVGREAVAASPHTLRRSAGAAELCGADVVRDSMHGYCVYCTAASCAARRC